MIDMHLIELGIELTTILDDAQKVEGSRNEDRVMRVEEPVNITSMNDEHWEINKYLRPKHRNIDTHLYMFNRYNL